MIKLYAAIFFYIVLVNILLSAMLLRSSIDNKIFEDVQNNHNTTISCIYNAWFVVTKTFRGVDINYVERNDGYLDCSQYPDENDQLVSCGRSGRYNNKNELCYLVISSFLSNVTF